MLYIPVWALLLLGVLGTSGYVGALMRAPYTDKEDRVIAVALMVSMWLLVMGVVVCG